MKNVKKLELLKKQTMKKMQSSTVENTEKPQELLIETQEKSYVSYIKPNHI